ncbi:MAG: PQQ-binding-like beta-propeller repeat protein [bacterium]|nr:PQQ-binding-like beta-propeller repeat protein [bacterium]
MNSTLVTYLLSILATSSLLAAPFTPVDLPTSESGQPRTRCASLAGTTARLYFTRYWADTLPGTFCPFYAIPISATSATHWSTLAPVPKFVQEPPSWFTTNSMKFWAGNGMSYGDVAGQPFLFIFGSIAKGGTGEDIGRDLLGYNITLDAWDIVTNRYDSGGADAACTFVATNSIYGYWTGWTPMQRWAWDKNSLGVLQQATVGSSALHPVDGTRVGNLGVFVIFQSGLPSAKLITHSAGTLDNQTVPVTLPWNVGMGCAIEYVPASLSLSGQHELWILRGGSGPNTGDGQANTTPTDDLCILTFTNTPSSIAITGQRTLTLPLLTGAEGSDMARVSNLMYFLRHNGASNPELYFLPVTYQPQDPPLTPWPLNGNNKQRQGWYTNGWPLTTAKLVWSNKWQVGTGIWGSGAAGAERFYMAVDPASNSWDLLCLSLSNGAILWGANLMDWANGTPALSHNRVYIGDNAGFAYCLDKLTGALIWSNFLGAGSCNGGVLLHNNRVYIEADGNAGGTFCLDADSGSILWHNNEATNAGTWSGNGPSLSKDGKSIYVHTEGDPGGQIFAINALTGSTEWRRVFASGWGGQEPIVDNAGNLYCAVDGLTASDENDFLISLKPNGQTNWYFNLGMHNAWFHGGYALSPDGSTIYCSRRSGGGATGIGLTAINTATGTKKWDLACGDTFGGCVVGAGNIIVGVFQHGSGAAAKGIRDDGATGTVIWTIPLDPQDNSWSWPAILSNGDVVVQTEYGTIARITRKTPAPPIGWCNLQWPYTLTVYNTNAPGISDVVYGQVWIPGATESPGATPGLYAWLGYGPTNDWPNAPSWSWIPAAFNVQVGNNDEFSNRFTISQSVPAGTYAYCFYYEYHTNDIPSTGYGQKDGGPKSLATYSPAQSGILTVIPEPMLPIALGVMVFFSVRRSVRFLSPCDPPTSHPVKR